jgi:tetratricopeptide (TPR) repeat protein
MLICNRRLLVFICISLHLLLSSLRPPHAIGQDSDSEAIRHFTAAQKAQDAGDFDAAAREYLVVIHLRPDAAEAYASLGLIYNAQGKFAESAQDLRKAEKLKPSLPGVSLYLGIDYERQRKAALAVTHLMEAVHLDSANKDANIWLARALWDDGRTQESLVQMRKTSVLFPVDPELLLNLGEAYHEAAEQGIQRVLGQSNDASLDHQVYGDIYKDERTWENAMAHYYRALEQDPHWRGAHFGLGEVALHREKLDAAAQEYHQELQADPADSGALARLGQIALLEGKPEDALPLFSAAIHIAGYRAANALGLPRPYPPASQDLSEGAQAQLRLSLPVLEAAPASPPRSLALALTYARLGNNEAFQSAWKSFSDAMPRSSASDAYKRGINSFDRQDFETAATDLSAWLKLHPNDLRADYLLATTYRNLSLATLEQLLVAAPDSYPAHQLLAETYQNVEQDDKALTEYRVVENMAPNLSGVHFSIGHLLLKAGQQDQAREELAAELRLNPDHAAANAEMGTLLLDQVDAIKATPYLEKAVKLDPDLWATYRQLGKAFYMQKDYTRAEAALKQALPHDPEGLAHYQLGLVYRSLGQKAAAAEQFEISRKLKLQGLTHDERQMTTLKSLNP